MKLEKIIKILNEYCDEKLQEDWDNSGLLIGDTNSCVKKMMLALDITDDIIEEATLEKVDLIISHHPMIFEPIKKINNLNACGSKIIKLIKNNINVYAMHTNIDKKQDGLNDYLLLKLGVKNGKILCPEKRDLKKSINVLKYRSCEKESLAMISSNNGFGRFYTLETEKSFEEYIKFVKEKLNLKFVRAVFSKKENIKKVAIINGSGMSFLKECRENKIDLLITGDIKHHNALLAKEYGINLIDITHYESEVYFCDILKKILNEKLDGVEIIVNTEENIFKIK